MCNPPEHDNNTLNMVVFLLAVMPLTYWGIQYLFDQDNVRMADRILPFFYGFITAIPVILLKWALDVYFPLNWNPLGIYVFAFFNKEGIILYPILILLFLLFRKKSYSGIPLRELTAWFCGFYFMIALSEALVLRNAATPYAALLLPMLRIFTVLIMTTLLVRSMHAYSNVMKIIYTVLYFTAPLILNFIPVLDILNKNLLFYMAFCVLGGVSAVLYFLESRGNLS